MDRRMLNQTPRVWNERSDAEVFAKALQTGDDWKYLVRRFSDGFAIEIYDECGEWVSHWTMPSNMDRQFSR